MTSQKLIIKFVLELAKMLKPAPSHVNDIDVQIGKLRLKAIIKASREIIIAAVTAL